MLFEKGNNLYILFFFTQITYLSHVLLFLSRLPLLISTVGLELPSITYSPHRLPSYFRPLPRTPAYRSELLVLVALAAGAKAVGSPLRPFNEIRYWTMGVAGGRWSEQQLIAAEEVFFPWLDTVTFTEEGIWAIKDEMENIGVLRGKLFTWI